MTSMLQEDIKNGKAPSAYPQPRPFTSLINTTPLTVWCVAFQMFPPRGNMHTRTCVSISWCTLLPPCGTAPWPLVETGLSSATRQPAPSWTPVLLPQMHRAGLDPCTGSALRPVCLEDKLQGAACWPPRASAFTMETFKISPTQGFFRLLLSAGSSRFHFQPYPV